MKLGLGSIKRLSHRFKFDKATDQGVNFLCQPEKKKVGMRHLTDCAYGANWCCNSDNFLLTCLIRLSTHLQKPASSFMHCTFRRGNVHLPLPLPLTKKTLPPHHSQLSPQWNRDKKIGLSWFRRSPQEYLSPAPVNSLSYQLFIPYWKWPHQSSIWSDCQFALFPSFPWAYFSGRENMQKIYKRNP